MTTPPDFAPLPAPDPWGCLVAVALLALALWLAGCAAPRDPQASRVVLPDGMTWWGPTCDVAQARARWYCDPSWRRDENIPALGYGR